MKYKRTIATAVAICSGVCALGATATGAQASAYCGVNGWDNTRGGYSVHYVGARANGMNCASVRYAMHEFRAKIRRQYGWPRLARPFFDGWVTWHCYKLSRHGVSCYENTSNTSYSFKAWVY